MSKKQFNSNDRQDPSKNGQATVAPDVLDAIESRYLRGETARSIAKSLGLALSTVRDLLDSTIKPSWSSCTKPSLDEQLAKLKHLERVCWEEYEESDEPEVRDTVVEAPDKAQHSKSRPGKLKVVKKTIVRSKRNNSGLPWIQMLLHIVDTQLKLLGAFKAPIEQPAAEFRVAGKTPSQVDCEMMALLEKRILERREREKALRGRGQL